MLIALTMLLALQSAPTADPAGENSVTVIPGTKYSGGWFHQFLLGSAWRELWKTEIRVPVADLDTFRGGLTAVDRGGHAQTLSLRFRAPDGRTYTFRSVNKNPTQGFTGILRSPVTRWFATEQISAMFPTAVLAVADLEDAAGLPHPPRWIAVLPDSPRLGKWRDEFKGMLGVFERRFPEGDAELPEVPGAVELISTDSLFPRLSRGSGRLDQSRFLTARLLDMLVGDWDRHAGQWSWIGVERAGVRWWTPMPRDRDWAFSRFDGVGNDLIRFVKPSWLEFGPRYGRIIGFTKSALPLDHRLLTGLSRDDWRTAVADLQGRLPDSVIANALDRLPQEFDRAVLDDVGRSLRLRRDNLGALADQYYRSLAQAVDIRASDQSELADLTRDPDGGVLLELFGPDRSSTYRRQFSSAETREIRLHLLGGPDTVRIHGTSGGILVRVITGGGADAVVDSTGGNALRVYDDSASAQISSTGPVSRSTRPFHPPVPPEDPRQYSRDWGRRLGVAPWFGIRPEVGVVLGAGPVLYTYGFRRVPYQSKIAVRVGTTTQMGKLNADLNADFRFERPDRRLVLHATLLNADVIRYFGLGNETARAPDISFHNVTQRRYSAEPTVVLGMRGPGRLELGGLVRWSEPDARETLLALQHPYGSGSFTEAGLTAALGYDSRDDAAIPTRGATLKVAGELFPRAFDVTSTFGAVSVVGTTYFTAASLPAQPTLALRAGARRVYGAYPFFEAADLGGRETFRGLTTRRLTGDAAVYGNVDLRFTVTKSAGVLALADVGRVYLQGERSGRWHAGGGGGIWVASSEHVLSVTLAAAGETARVYLHTGFHF